MGIKVTGLDKLEKQLSDMSKAAEKLSRQTSVPFSELFTYQFMRKYTNFSNIDELFVAGGFSVSSQEDFEAIPDEEFDVHVRACTKFKSFQDMLDTAGSEYVTSQLGF